MKSTFIKLFLLILIVGPQIVLDSAEEDPLPSWNPGEAKEAILDFVKAASDPASRHFVQPEERIATFDQDGTLWVEHPIYTQVVYALDKIRGVVEKNQILREIEPYRTILSNDSEAMAKLSTDDFKKVLILTLAGMPVDTFIADVKQWLKTARHPRWNRPYTQLTYLPMQELLHYLRQNGFKTYIVTGGGQDFVRAYAEQVYGIPPEQIVGSVDDLKYQYGPSGEPLLIREPRLLLNDNFEGKPEGIHLMIGRRPYAAFGNSTGDRQMLEYTGAGKGIRLMMLVLHDDAAREYAYGPAKDLPETRIGLFSQSLYDEAKKQGWIVISMKNDWKKIFSFD